MFSDSLRMTVVTSDTTVGMNTEKKAISPKNMISTVSSDDQKRLMPLRSSRLIKGFNR